MFSRESILKSTLAATSLFVAVSLAGCDIIGGGDDDPVTLEVMSWNVYIGSPVRDVLRSAANGRTNVNSLGEITAPIIRNPIEALSFEERAEAIADKIVVEQPDVVGLQEVAKGYFGPFDYDGSTGSCSLPRSNVDGLNYRATLMAEIQRQVKEYNSQGADYEGYRVASVYDNSENDQSTRDALEFPSFYQGSADYRLGEQYLILVRKDIEIVNEKIANDTFDSDDNNLLTPDVPFPSRLKLPFCVPNDEVCVDTEKPGEPSESLELGAEGVSGLLNNFLLHYKCGETRSDGEGFIQPVDRGYHASKIRKGGKKFTIFNTHLENRDIFSGSEVPEEIENSFDGDIWNERQHLELKRTIEEVMPDNFVSSNKFENVIIMGDFNTRQYAMRSQYDGPLDLPYYNNFDFRYGYRKRYVVPDSGPTCCFNSDLEPDGQPELTKQIDHVAISRDLSPDIRLAVTVGTDPSVDYPDREQSTYPSDHAGVLVRFQVD